jgi:hypothetical protein
LHAPDVPFVPPATKADWREQLARIERENAGWQVDLAPGLATAALVCLAGAAWAWKRKRGPHHAVA